MFWSVIVVYLILINIITFIVRGIDKRRSIKHKWRISEKELLILSAIGGFIGAVIGMTTWHHKTIKGKFLWKFWLIVFAWIITLSLFYYFLYL